MTIDFACVYKCSPLLIRPSKAFNSQNKLFFGVNPYFLLVKHNQLDGLFLCFKKDNKTALLLYIFLCLYCTLIPCIFYLQC